MKKALFALLLVGVLAFAVIASGCIGGETTTTSTTSSPTQTTTPETTSSPTETTTSPPTETTTTTTTQEKVTIVIWHAIGPNELKAFEDLIAEDLFRIG